MLIGERPVGIGEWGVAVVDEVEEVEEKTCHRGTERSEGEVTRKSRSAEALAAARTAWQTARAGAKLPRLRQGHADPEGGG